MKFALQTAKSQNFHKKFYTKPLFSNNSPKNCLQNLVPLRIVKFDAHTWSHYIKLELKIVCWFDPRCRQATTLGEHSSFHFRDRNF